ncbi:hypothetical protein, conserved [Plasmodium gonderi]|uniref:Uncharacterized protein n=1 Tax=Plasmodium gonderi TaxID=77519 RepID=A0A1Y1J9B7_PLAGO|nr:hypothetical protein, conserved [Plasmodium gonderi]GAW79096.1 hypothetical protein, conserved [Plasmodium gonderi]
MKNLVHKKHTRSLPIIAHYSINLFRKGRILHYVKYFNSIQSKDINGFITQEKEAEDPIISQNSKKVIERYKNFIDEKRRSNKQNSSTYFTDKGELHNEISTDRGRKVHNEIESSKADATIPTKDEKYVILKKQITKEFIYQVFLPHVESQIMYHLKTYTPNQIVNIFNIYSYLYYYDKKKEMVDALLEYLEYRLDCFSVQDILLILEPLYILNKTNNIYIYRLIINYLDTIKEKLNIYNYIGISRVFTKILIDITFEENEKKKNNFFMSRLWHYLKQSKFRKSIPSDQRKISHQDFLIQFMSTVVNHIEEQLHLLSPIELTDLLSVISNYSFKSGYSRYDVPGEQNQETNRSNQNDLNNSKRAKTESCSNDFSAYPSSSISSLHVHDLTKDNAYFFKENIMSFIIASEIKKKYQELSTLHKITNFYNMSKLCMYDEEYINLVENDMKNYHYINNIHHKYLCLLVWCLFKYKILHKHLEILRPIIIQNIANFNGKDLSRLCHAIFNEKKILNSVANNLISQIANMSVNEFLCYFYAVVCLDLLPYDVKSSSSESYQKSIQNGPQCMEANTSNEEKNLSLQKLRNRVETQKEMTLSLFNKSEILQKCTKFINDNKKDIGKNEMTKIILLLKKKKNDKYFYVLDMLPDEWKNIVHLVN